MIRSCGTCCVLIYILATTFFYCNQVSAGEQPLLVEALYKETQEYFTRISKAVEDRGYVVEDAKKDKSVLTLKSYVELASDNILTILRNFEKDTAPLQPDIRKSITDIQKDAVELSKTVRKTEIYATFEKFHESYLESLRKLSDKICDTIKIAALRRMVPEGLQSGAEQVYVQILSVTRTVQRTISGKGR